MTTPIKTCGFCNATGVMPTFMDGTTVCYDCLPKLPKTLKEAWREIASLRAKVEQSVPIDSIGKLLTQAMDVAVANGANSVSMPDEYVEVAAWLSGVQPAPKPEGA